MTLDTLESARLPVNDLEGLREAESYLVAIFIRC